jgi:LmbE family N-acetylglucosaminyl deacetylase
LLSPHFDDACFSLGGLLSKEEFEDLVILDIFSKSQYGPNIKLLKPYFKIVNVFNLNFFRRTITDHVSEVRRREDQRFCESISAVQRTLFFKDASLRDLVNEYSYDAESIVNEPIFDNVSNAIEKVVISDDYNSVFCPLAIGNQVDHLIVMKAIKMLRRCRAIHSKVFFYEDLPYASACELSYINSLALERIGNSNSIFIDITTELPRKKELMSIYHSQSMHGCKERISYHAKRLFLLGSNGIRINGYCERLWGSS